MIYHIFYCNWKEVLLANLSFFVFKLISTLVYSSLKLILLYLTLASIAVAKDLARKQSWWWWPLQLKPLESTCSVLKLENQIKLLLICLENWSLSFSVCLSIYQSISFSHTLFHMHIFSSQHVHDNVSY